MFTGIASGGADVGTSRIPVRCQPAIVSANTSGIGFFLPQPASISTKANRSRVISLDATIALMAKFKLVRPKGKKGPAPQGALGCVILILLAIVAVMFFMYFAVRG
jgi:hypothetical protein